LKIVNIIAIAFSFSFVSDISFSGKGSGTVSNTYQIKTIELLKKISYQLTDHYVLINNIDASDKANWYVRYHNNNFQLQEYP
jgi:hypothetical protein